MPLTDDHPKQEDQIDYFYGILTFDKLEKLTESISISLDDGKKEIIRNILSESEILHDFYEFYQNLSGITTNTLVQVIKSEDDSKIAQINREQEDKDRLNDKVWLAIYMFNWDWENKLSLFQAFQKATGKKKVETNSFTSPSEISDIDEKQLVKNIRKRLEQENKRRSYKIWLEAVKWLTGEKLLLSFKEEKSKGAYREFGLRVQDSSLKRFQTTQKQSYYPLKTSTMTVDLKNKEYSDTIKRHSEDIVEIVLEELFDDYTLHGKISFSSPAEEPEKDFDTFFSEKAETAENSFEWTDLQDDEKEKRRKAIEDLEQAEVNEIDITDSPSTLKRAHLEDENSLEEYLEKHDVSFLEEELEKAKRAKFGIILGDTQLKITPNKLTFSSSPNQAYEDTIKTALTKDEQD